MSTYSGPQPQQKYEHTKSEGGGREMEGGAKPGAVGGGESATASGGKLGPVTAGSSSKIGKPAGGPARPVTSKGKDAGKLGE